MRPATDGSPAGFYQRRNNEFHAIKRTLYGGDIEHEGSADALLFHMGVHLDDLLATVLDGFFPHLKMRALKIGTLGAYKVLGGEDDAIERRLLDLGGCTASANGRSRAAS